MLQLAQYAAVAGGAYRITVAAQIHQLGLQRLQLGDAPLHMQQMIVDQLVDGVATGIGICAGLQQGADLGMGHIQRPAAPDKGETLQVMLIIVAIVVLLVAQGSGQQPLLLVVTHRLHTTTRHFGQLAYLHGRPLCLPLDPVVTSGCVMAA